MKKLSYFVSVILFLVTSCTPAKELPKAETAANTILPMPTLTRMPLPTATRRSASTPTIIVTPSLTLTPIPTIANPAHDLALSEDNVGLAMVRLNLITIDASREIKFSKAGIVDVDGTLRYVVAVIYPTGKIDIYDLRTGAVTRTFSVDCCEISGLAFSPDRKSVAIVSKEFLHFWDLQTQQVISEMDLKMDFSGPLAFSPNGAKVFVSHLTGDYVMEVDLQTKVSNKIEKNAYAYSFADTYAVENYHFNQWGNLVMLRYENNMPAFEDVVLNRKTIIPVEARSDSDFIEAYAISPDGNYLAFGTPTDIYVWDLDKFELLSTLSGHAWAGGDGWFGKIRSLVFSPQSDLLVSVGWDDTTRLWNIHSGQQIRRLNVCCSASFTPDGRYLVTAGDGVMRVWGIP